MKDFLNELADQEAISKNPFKAFAAYTALKFEDVDEKCKAVGSTIEQNKHDITLLNEQKLDETEFNKFLRDYDAFKSKMTVYVIVATVIINIVTAILTGVFMYLLKTKI